MESCNRQTASGSVLQAGSSPRHVQNHCHALLLLGTFYTRYVTTWPMFNPESVTILRRKGSAVLHALPQYLSTYNTQDASMMFSFFILQGLLVLLEQLTSSYFGLQSVLSSQIPMRARHQWLSELLTISFFLSLVYCCIETDMGWTQVSEFLLIYICNFHVLSHLLLIYMWKLHWNLNTMFICQVNSFWFTYVISMS
jgi:hypothetical protein